eukprot:305134-Pleurochrysis_carterae.AAC.1
MDDDDDDDDDGRYHFPFSDDGARSPLDRAFSAHHRPSRAGSPILSSPSTSNSRSTPSPGLTPTSHSHLPKS